MSKANERIGQSIINNQELKMTIIAYRNADHIDVLFDDGTIVYNKQYANFIKGSISNPNHKQNSRIGMTSKATNGQIMTICDYKNSQNVWVKFPDGTIVGPIKMCHFNTGKVENPNFRTNHQVSFNELVCAFYFKTIGFKKQSNGFYKKLGLKKMSFDLYNPELKLAIEYDGYGHYPQKDANKNKIAKELGIKIIRIREAYLPKIYDHSNEIFILHDTNWFSDELLSIIQTIYNNICTKYYIYSILTINKKTDFKKIETDYLSHQPGKKYVGLQGTSSQHQNMEIIEYVSYKNITVRFSDGTIVKKARLDHFFSGKISNPNYYRTKHVGETRLMLNKQMATITDYDGCYNCTIKFEDGTNKEGVYYSAFKDGRVKNNNYLKSKWNGKKFVNDKGLTAVIIDYINYNNVMVRFDDGTVITTRIDALQDGKFNNPNDSYGRVGEIKYLKNGGTMRIIKYINAKDIDVMFDDGVIATHKRYEHFCNGHISKPRNCT